MHSLFILAGSHSNCWRNQKLVLWPFQSSKTLPHQAALFNSAFYSHFKAGCQPADHNPGIVGFCSKVCPPSCRFPYLNDWNPTHTHTYIYICIQNLSSKKGSETAWFFPPLEFIQVAACNINKVCEDWILFMAHQALKSLNAVTKRSGTDTVAGSPKKPSCVNRSLKPGLMVNGKNSGLVLSYSHNIIPNNCVKKTDLDFPSVTALIHLQLLRSRDWHCAYYSVAPSSSGTLGVVSRDLIW